MLKYAFAASAALLGLVSFAPSAQAFDHHSRHHSHHSHHRGGFAFSGRVVVGGVDCGVRVGDDCGPSHVVVRVSEPTRTEIVRREKDCADADLDIDGEMSVRDGCPRLRVKYEIDVDDPQPGDHYTLVLRLTDDDDRILLDKDGRPVVIGVPLDRPQREKKDELKFKQTITFDLPGLAQCLDDDDDLELKGEVINDRTGRVMDRDHDSIDVDD